QWITKHPRDIRFQIELRRGPLIWRLIRRLIGRLPGALFEAGAEIRRLLVIGGLIIARWSAVSRGLRGRQFGSALLTEFSGLFHLRSALCAEFGHSRLLRNFCRWLVIGER